MKQKNRKTRRLRRPAAALLAGLLAVSLLPASALATQAETADPDMMDIVAAAEIRERLRL